MAINNHIAHLRPLFIFLLKFAAFFMFFYFTTLAVIGVSTPGNHYISFVDKYLDYITGIKIMILHGVKILLSVFNIQTQIDQGFRIRIMDGKAVIVAMSCVGYTVYSIWLAYILASIASVKSKITWAVTGLLLLFFINVVRIAAFLYAHNKGTSLPLGLDHHTWFNIIAYTFILIMIFGFERFISKQTNIDHKK